MSIPIAVQILGKTYTQVDRLLGKPRAIGAGHSFHEYSRSSGAYYVVFDGGRSVLVTITLRQLPISPQQALAAVGLSTTGKKPVSQGLLESRWENLGGVPMVIVRATGGKRWDTVELKRR